MNRYYVEFAIEGATQTEKRMGVYTHPYGKPIAPDPEVKYLYVMAYSEQHVRDIFPDYNIVAIDQTD